jgi:hypothetical protein
MRTYSQERGNPNALPDVPHVRGTPGFPFPPLEPSFPQRPWLPSRPGSSLVVRGVSATSVHEVCKALQGFGRRSPLCLSEPGLPLVSRPAAATQQPDAQVPPSVQSASTSQHCCDAAQHDPVGKLEVGGQHVGLVGGHQPPPSSDVQQISFAARQSPFGFWGVTGQHFGRPGGQPPPPWSLAQHTPPVGPHEPAGSCDVAGQHNARLPVQQRLSSPQAPVLQTQAPFTQVCVLAHRPHDLPQRSAPQTRPAHFGLQRFFRFRRRRFAASLASSAANSVVATNGPAASRARKLRRVSLSTAAFSAVAKRPASSMEIPGGCQPMAAGRIESIPRPCDALSRHHQPRSRPLG